MKKRKPKLISLQKRKNHVKEKNKLVSGLKLNIGKEEQMDISTLKILVNSKTE